MKNQPRSEIEAECEVMPYGTFTGLPMDSVPARYFHYLWTNGNFREKDKPDSVVHKYIVLNMEILKEQTPGMEW